MEIKYNKAKFKQILDDFYTVLHVSMGIFDMHFNLLYTSGETPDYCAKVRSTSHGVTSCACSDTQLLKRCAEKKQLVYHTCHAGLIDAAMPIFKKGLIVGYVTIGRLRTDTPFDKIYEKLNWLNSSKTEMQTAYGKLSTLSNAQLKSLSDLLSTIVFENAIDLETFDFQSGVVAYINDNLHSSLSVKDICSVMHMSKNVLYKNFTNAFGCTVNEFIILKRIEKAEELIMQTKENLYDIAEQVGLSNYTYFCRVFKKYTGYTPTKYRATFKKDRFD